MGNYKAIFLDEGEHQDEIVLRTMAPWLAQNFATVWIVSTRAASLNAPINRWLNAKDKKTNQPCFRVVQLRPNEALVKAPDLQTESIQEFFRAIAISKVAQNQLPGNFLRLTAHASLYWNWYNPPAHDRERYLQAARAARQRKKQELWRMYSKAPIHQGRQELEFVQNIMGDEDFELEMQNQLSAKHQHKQPAFEVESVRTFCRRARNRADLIKQLPDVFDDIHRPERVAAFWRGASHAMVNPLKCYIMFDPANASLGPSRSVILSAIKQNVVKPQWVATAKINRTLAGVEQAFGILDPTATAVR